MTVDARGVGFAELNERIRESKEENVNIVGCSVRDLLPAE